MDKFDLFNLKGKVSVVTGGCGHLGKGIVSALAAYGSEVWVLGQSEGKFRGRYADAPDNWKLRFVALNLKESESIDAAISEITEASGRIDILVNNAHYVSRTGESQEPAELSDADWAGSIDGVLNSAYRCMRAVIPVMKQTGTGKIINVASMYGIVAPDFALYSDHPQFRNPPHYGAAKAGVVQLGRYFASFLGGDGIQVYTVSPGPFPSPAVQKSEGFVEKLSAKTMVGRIGEPSDLAGLFVFLASNSSDYMSGQNFVIDGGWTQV